MPPTTQNQQPERNRVNEAINSAMTALVAPVVLPPYMLYKLGEMGVEGYKRVAELLERNLYRPPSPERGSEYTELAAEGLVSSIPGGPSVKEAASLGMIKGGTLGTRRATRKKMQTALSHFRKRPPRTWLKRTKTGDMAMKGGTYVLSDRLEPTISSKMVRGILLHGGDPSHYPKMGQTFKDYLAYPYFGEPWGISTTLLPSKVRDFIKQPKKFYGAVATLANKHRILQAKAFEDFPLYQNLIRTGQKSDAWEYLRTQNPALLDRMDRLKDKINFLETFSHPFLRVQPLWTDVPERLILDNTTPRGWHTHTDAVLEALQDFPEVWRRTGRGAELDPNYYHVIDDDVEKRVELSKKVAKNLQKRGYMGILSNPHRYGEFELRIFPPEKLMAIDRRIYKPGSTLPKKTDPGIQRLSGMLQGRTEEYKMAKGGRPAHMGGPGSSFRTFGPEYGNLKGKAAKTGPLAWGYKPWTGLKPQKIGRKRMEDAAARQTEKLETVSEGETKQYLADIVKTGQKLAPEEVEAMKVLKEFDPSYKTHLDISKHVKSSQLFSEGMFVQYVAHPDSEFFKVWMPSLSTPDQKFIEKIAEQYNNGLLTKTQALGDINEQLQKSLKGYKEGWLDFDFNDLPKVDDPDTLVDLGAEFDEAIELTKPTVKKPPVVSTADQISKIDEILKDVDMTVAYNYDTAQQAAKQCDQGLITFNEYLGKLIELKKMQQLWDKVIEK